MAEVAITESDEVIAVETIFLRDLINDMKELTKSSANLYANNNNSYFLLHLFVIEIVDFKTNLHWWSECDIVTFLYKLLILSKNRGFPPKWESCAYFRFNFKANQKL